MKAKIELNISPQEFAALLDDLEHGREFGYDQIVADAEAALYKAASVEDQKAISQATAGKYEWLKEARKREGAQTISEKQPMDGARILSPHLKPDPKKYKAALKKWANPITPK